MHVLFLQRTLYGADVDAVLEKLRADPAVRVRGRRSAAATRMARRRTIPCSCPPPGRERAVVHAHAELDGRGTRRQHDQDLSATDAVSAWASPPAAPGMVIADVDTGVRFDHPDLLRAGFGGRLLPGYDFVGQDYDPTTGAAAGYLSDRQRRRRLGSRSVRSRRLDRQHRSAEPAVRRATLPAPSSWHGTRVVGVLGAITNNDAGIAGMTWGPWILPVRALGKCGGYDSDIIAGHAMGGGHAVTNPTARRCPTIPIPPISST